ncbi:GyrI-like domain-containing protein [Paenibacillus mesophilus]|uniref:GyrI-like domain-containing protein n=1 Tax=Paenibacillus mesophilus TaxID=2582849 RepID=UPI00110DECD3|nr:GyrI-like domain-containing protein [Paenibacillus mesophilus]TMV43821.1 GyrI-like domain-containing protein [Paenibacillus mesophilus]
MPIIDIRIVQKPSFKAVGLPISWTPESVNPADNELSKLWGRFNPRANEIPFRVPGKMYGLEQFKPGFKPGDPIDYVACVEVSEAGDIPHGMVSADIPEASYVVVTCKGTINDINSAYGHFWSTWLGQHPEYEVVPGWNFEYYDERFLGNASPDSEYSVWFPVRLRQGGS